MDLVASGGGEGKGYFVGLKAAGEPRAPVLEVRTMPSFTGEGKAKGRKGKLVKKRPGASVVSLAVSVSMENDKEEREEPITVSGTRAKNMLGIRFSSLSERGKNARKSISARDEEVRATELRSTGMLPPIRPPSPLWAGCSSVVCS